MYVRCGRYDLRYMSQFAGSRREWVMCGHTETHQVSHDHAILVSVHRRHGGGLMLARAQSRIPRVERQVQEGLLGLWIWYLICNGEIEQIRALTCHPSWTDVPRALAFALPCALMPACCYRLTGKPPVQAQGPQQDGVSGAC
jgi:hypothetical protein